MQISTYIQNDLAARLKSGSELPVQLTIDSLAEHYNVSFTPVRTAVSRLIDEGLLKKGANRRLVVTVRSGRGKQSRRPPELPQQPKDPYDEIASDLVQLSLQGEPVYLREEATAERYDISRSTLRNILLRLAGDGVVDHIPRRGWRLRPFRQSDLRAFIEVREALELKALVLAAPKLVVSELQRMLEANVPPVSAEDPPRIDETLHEYIVKASGNTYIKDFFERQGRYYRLLFEWEDHDREIAIETIRQHREILTALLAKDWSAARKALSHHILNNHPILNRVAANGESRDNNRNERGG